MHHAIKVTLFSLLTVIMAGAQASEHPREEQSVATTATDGQQQVINATGMVKDVDIENKKVTIEHDAISSVNWPAMTMRFTFTTLDSTISELQPGNRIEFSFIQQDKIFLLKDIKIIRS